MSLSLNEYGGEKKLAWRCFNPIEMMETGFYVDFFLLSKLNQIANQRLRNQNMLKVYSFTAVSFLSLSFLLISIQSSTGTTQSIAIFDKLTSNKSVGCFLFSIKKNSMRED